MSTLTVEIMLHGLIALMPVTTDGVEGSNHMKALLVDARQPPENVEIECFIQHHPRLKVFTNPDECLAAGCSSNSFECTCVLDRKELALVIDPPFEPPRQQLSKEPSSSLPFDFNAAGDFGYLANLAHAPLNMRIDPAVLKPMPPLSLVARMDFPFSSVTACALAVRREEGSNNVHVLSFRPLGTLEQTGDMKQAVAQMAIARLPIPYSDTPAPQVKVAIGRFGESPQFLTLRPAGSKVEIELTNAMSMQDEPEIDAPCDDGIARHFAFYYQILQSSPPWPQRPVPHVKPTQWKSASDLRAEGCDPTKDPMSRPICPMGAVNP